MENRFSSVSYNESLKQKKLVGSKCRKCGRLFLPPRPICSHCRNKDMESVDFKGKGKLIAFTVVYAPPPLMIEEGFSREKPYCAGVVELEGEVRISARIVGVDVTKPDRIKIGTPVEVEFVSYPHGGENKVFLAFKVTN